MAVVTTPFAFEGTRRKENALEGITKLKEFVDATVIISNDNLKTATKANVTLMGCPDSYENLSKLDTF